MSLLEDVTAEIVDLHDAFVRWFSGELGRGELDQLAGRFDPAVIFVSPDGQVIRGAQLMERFQKAHGTNPDIRIQIRDVEIQRELPDHILVTYTEWQWSAIESATAQKGRFTTALLSRNKPFKWFHVHETRLPDP